MEEKIKKAIVSIQTPEATHAHDCEWMLHEERECDCGWYRYQKEVIKIMIELFKELEKK